MPTGAGPSVELQQPRSPADWLEARQLVEAYATSLDLDLVKVTTRTVMAHFYNAAESGQISREDWIRVAHQHGVPCFNDAAADVPPISNLWKYTGMGFDLVTFSGGKGIRGPQNAGFPSGISPPPKAW